MKNLKTLFIMVIFAIVGGLTWVSLDPDTFWQRCTTVCAVVAAELLFWAGLGSIFDHIEKDKRKKDVEERARSRSIRREAEPDSAEAEEYAELVIRVAGLRSIDSDIKMRDLAIRMGEGKNWNNRHAQ